jgi:hypothetical protein
MRASWITLPIALLVATASAVSVTVGQVGCSDNTSNFVTRDQFAGQYAQALCSSLTHCCQENDVTQNYAQCTQGWETAVNNLLNGPGSSGNYDVTAATNCIAAVRNAQDGSCQPVDGSLSAARPQCQAVFAGQLPLGAPCTSAGQCAPIDGGEVACAVVPGDGGAGGGGGGQLPLAAGIFSPGITLPRDVPVCVQVVPPEGGSNPIPCTINATAGSDTCTAQGMYCDPTSLTCQALNAAGGGCDPSVATSCQPGNYCAAGSAVASSGGDGGTGAMSPILHDLHPLATDGGDGGDDAAPDALAEAGDDASATDAAPADDASDEASTPEASTSEGGGGTGDGGGGGTASAPGVCAPQGPIGSPCSSLVMCDATGTCNTASQTCVALEPPGSSCTSGSQCTIGVCDATTHKCLTNAIATTAACNGSTQ